MLTARLVILAALAIVVTLGVSRMTDAGAADTTADDGYVGAPGNVPTPSPHFAYQQAALAQATGLAPLTLPQPSRSLPPGQAMDLGNGLRPTMPEPLAQRRQVLDMLRDVLTEARKAGSHIQASDVRALVVDGDQAYVVVECNCSPRALLVARAAPDAPVRYLTFRIDRRYPGVNVAAGPETDEIRDLIRRSQPLPPGFR